MPTGYTAGVQSGEITDLRTFALTCARAFGALITMRDDPWDAPIPERLEPSTYSRDRLEEAQKRLVEAEAWTPAEIEAAATAAYRERLADWEQSTERTAATEERYRAMLEQVEAWEPPTPDHAGLKDFMSEQLRNSISFDCGFFSERPKPESPEEWHAQYIAALARDVKYHAEQWEVEQRRTEERNRWLAALHESLPGNEVKVTA